MIFLRLKKMRATTLATYWRRPSRPRCFGLVCLLCCCFFFFLFNLCSFRFNFSVQPTFVRCFVGQVCLWVHIYICVCLREFYTQVIHIDALSLLYFGVWGFLPAISAYWCLRVLLYCCIFCNSVVCFYVGVYRAPSSSPYKCRLARHIMGHLAIQSHFCSFYVCLSVSRVSLSLSLCMFVTLYVLIFLPKN